MDVIKNLKKDLIKYKLDNYVIEFEDGLKCVLIIDSYGVESVPYEMIDKYYVVCNQVKPHENKLGIRLLDSSIIKIPIKHKMLQQAV